MKKFLLQTAIVGAMMVSASAASAACVKSNTYLFGGCTLTEFATSYFTTNFTDYKHKDNVVGFFTGHYWLAKVLVVGPNYIIGGDTFDFADNKVTDLTAPIAVPFESAGAGLPVLAAMAGYLAWRRRSAASV
ncbi:hypothetical protein [Mongoliimonas terrestris]|uniref:hypothetical protein n=1 Tax=Mongoliimonas terrestris TaxID=1709001 RepID=UPI000949A54B|nr:hypothetical protein [Mongoliimonas terrestris]